MSPPFHEIEDAAKAIEPLRLELERYRRELDECRKRMGELEHTEALLAGEKRILELVARGIALPEILGALCRLIEDPSVGSLCASLWVDHAAKCMEHGAAPGRPQSYNDATHSRPVKFDAGPCGMAACLKEQVIVP